MVQNHGGLQPLRDFFHIPATAFAETMDCLNKIDVRLSEIVSQNWVPHFSNAFEV
jgi:hypothetical protein